MVLRERDSLGLFKIGGISDTLAIVVPNGSINNQLLGVLCIYLGYKMETDGWAELWSMVHIRTPLAMTLF